MTAQFSHDIVFYMGAIRPHSILILFLSLLFAAPSVYASVGTSPLHLQYLKKDRRSGYYEDLDSEKSVSTPMALQLPAPIPAERPIQETIFNDNLSREFTLRYETQFGRTSAEQNYFLYSNPASVYRTPSGSDVSAVQTSTAQREFGEFMFRRLAEYHVDAYVKTDRSMRKVYEMKEKLSRVQMEVSPGVSVKANYSLSGNAVDVAVDNPWVTSRAWLDVGRQEATLSLIRGITSSVSAETHYAIRDGIFKLIGRKQFSANLSGSLMAATFFNDSGYSTREHIGLAGVSIIF